MSQRREIKSKTTNKMKKYESMTVGQIVADSFSNADVLSKFGIDFCCNGGDSVMEACRKSKADQSAVLAAIAEPRTTEAASGVEFRTWPLDLLSDYILKHHHRNIRSEGPQIALLLEKVCLAHGEHHPELLEVREIFTASLADLYSHLEKEEVVLFPYIYEMYNAAAQGVTVPALHCGSVSAPISVMMSQHDAEGDRYHKIEALTFGYRTPADGCNSYRLLMEKLKAFNTALHQHIHLENNIVFPAAIALERQVCSKI